jgi:hypothetical protein
MCTVVKVYRSMFTFSSKKGNSVVTGLLQFLREESHSYSANRNGDSAYTLNIFVHDERMFPC